MKSASEPAIEGAPQVAQYGPRRPHSSILRSALKLARTRIGLALVSLVVLIAIVGPYTAPHASDAFVGMPNADPSYKALLGTDYLGQDILSRFLDGGRSILAMAVVGVGVGVAIGIAIGLIAAYARNVLDDVLMRAMDVILAFPAILLALVLVATVGAHAWVIVLAIVLTTVPRVARVTRGAAQPIVESDFVAAAEALGVARWRILVAEVLPNTMSPLLVEVSLRLTYGIGIIASLAFLGLAPNPNGANWGTMIQENQIALSIQPWGVVVPIIAIALLTMGTGLIGDGIARTSAGIDRGHGAP